MTGDQNAPKRPALSDAAIKRIRRILMRWGRRNYKGFPWRSASRPWQALIAEVLLQRTRAKNVVPVYKAFMSKYRTAISLRAATEEDIGTLIGPLGLRWRVPLLTRLCHALAERRGRIPCDFGELVELPGVGPYAAAATLSLHCGQRFPIVDANVVRWICRLVGEEMDGETRRKRWLLELADRITPGRGWQVFNYAALDFTMEICVTHPRCRECPIGAGLCVYGSTVLAARQ